MNTSNLAALSETIDRAFEERDGINTSTRGEVRDAVETALNLLDGGKVRVAERGADGNWTVNQWLKKAVLLSFRLNPMEIVKGGPGESAWWDKVPPSSTAGASTNSRRPASAPCRTAWCAARPISRPTPS